MKNESYRYPVTEKESSDGGADLHLHTNFSDGTYSVERLIRTAADLGLRTIAITDHDSVGAISQAMPLGVKYGVDILPGIELSCASHDSEIHILGYCIDFRNKVLIETLRRVQEIRRERMALMIGKLASTGIRINAEDFFRSVSAESISRLHLAEYLSRNKQVSSIREAFQRFIGDNKPCYMSVNAFTLKDGIEFITDNGGVPVYAHPAVTRRDELIPQMVELGLKGIEVYNAAHSAESIKKYKELAETKGLLLTGGSDCHGLNKGAPLLGKVRMPNECVERIRLLSGVC